MRNYFDEADRFAHENYSNYGGWSNMGGDYNYFDEYAYQDGGVSHEAAALPYVINIANSTTDDVSGVVFLGANQNLFNATNFGNPASITITMDNGSVTYTEFLESIKSNPFEVGFMYLESSTAGQPFKALTLTYNELNGRSNATPVTPRKDPMQNQSDVTVVNYSFPVNAKLEISTTILASATLTVSLYPKTVIDPSRTLVGRSADKGFVRPNLSQIQVPSGRPLVGR